MNGSRLRKWMGRGPLTAIAFTAMVVGTTLGTVGTSGATSSSPVSNLPTSYTLNLLNGKMAAQNGIVGPNGKGYPTFSPTMLTVPAATPLQVTIIDYATGKFNFTVKNPAISDVIPTRISAQAPSVSTFTTEFANPGRYRFYCAKPCSGGWAATSDKNKKGPSRDGFLAGYVLAVASTQTVTTTSLVVSSDIVGNVGTSSCVGDTLFKVGDTVVFRIRVYDPTTGQPMDNTMLSSVVITLPDGTVLKASYSNHNKTSPDVAASSFWTNCWKVPVGYPTGTVNYTISATANSGQTGKFVPFNVAASFLQIVAS